MSSNAIDGSSSGEKNPAERQPTTTPSRRYVGILKNKRCCVCEAADSPKKRHKRTKKVAAAGPSFAHPSSSPAVKSEPPEESICVICKTVFTTKEDLIMHGICTSASRGHDFDLAKLFGFHMVLEKKHDDEKDNEPAPFYGPPNNPTLAANFIPDLNLPPPPEYY